MNNPHQQILRTLNQEDRKEWFCGALRPNHSFGFWTVKVDGHLVAMGEEWEFPEMYDEFNRYIDGEDKSKRTGGMG